MNIKITDAHENNLKHINLSIPKNKLIVFTGLSGSGKSTLAMETLQRECQRQYMESMGLTMDMGSKPKVKSIEGLSPAISISQQSSNRNPRSTVGTITELAPFLRVVFSKIGERTCPHCGKTIFGYGAEGDNIVLTELPDSEESDDILYEEMMPCPHCGKSVVELSASHFSFNKPEGACKTCKGIGAVSLPNIDLLLDKTKSVADFAIKGWDQVFVDRYGASLVNAAKHYGFSIDITAPIAEYNEIQNDLLLYGVLSKQFSKHFPNISAPKTVPSGRFEGVVTNLMRRYEEKNSLSSQARLEKFLTQQRCPDCGGVRFCESTLAVKVHGVNITQALAMPLEELRNWLEKIKAEISRETTEVIGQVLSDLIERTNRIISVGGGYLCLNQPAISLSAGEIQRIKLASILGSGLTGVLYVLDEPTAGLHQRDRKSIIGVLFKLRDMGNTVIVIEHDLEIMRAADFLVDFGPGAGKNGGRIVASGTIENIIACDESVTGKYLSGKIKQVERKLGSGNEKYIHITNINAANLKNLDIDFPLGKLVAVSGVSGAGKTSLVFNALKEAAEAYFNSKVKQTNVTGFENIDNLISINGTSIGRSTRSNIASYTDLFADIRNLFAKIANKENLPLDAKHFSYNVAGGRCEKCQGAGKLLVPMHFLPDAYVVCPVCKGKRYTKSVLNVKHKDLSISDVLDLSIDEAVILLAEEKSIVEKLKILQEIGLGYLGLGQSTATLSGGEAQRLKLGKELSKQGSEKNLYLFDEPTTGLHPQDADRLIGVFDRLVQKGNTVIVIEHNLRVLLAADLIIDLGPEGGRKGGNVVARGTPAEIMKNSNSITGQMLAEFTAKI